MIQKKINTEKVVKEKAWQKRFIGTKRIQSIGEEIANSITHGVGLLFSIAALGLLFVHALSHGGVLYKLSLAFYGLSLVFMYFASMFYHSFKKERIKKIFHVLDHVAIYLLIAGTYAPITLIFLPTEWGRPLFLAVWLMAILGIVFKLFFMGKLRKLSVVFYILMGWAALFAIKPMLQTLPEDLLYWILAGGLFYTLGIVFYAWRRMPFHHFIWHLFVMGGSTAHFIGIFKHLKV